MQAFLATNASQQGFQHTHAIYGICRLSVDSFLVLRSSNSADLPRYDSPFMVLLLLHKRVRFQYSLCTWLPCRASLMGADTLTEMGLF